MCLTFKFKKYVDKYKTCNIIFEGIIMNHLNVTKGRGFD